MTWHFANTEVRFMRLHRHIGCQVKIEGLITGALGFSFSLLVHWEVRNVLEIFVCILSFKGSHLTPEWIRFALFGLLLLIKCTICYFKQRWFDTSSLHWVARSKVTRLISQVQPAPFMSKDTIKVAGNNIIYQLSHAGGLWSAYFIYNSRPTAGDAAKLAKDAYSCIFIKISFKFMMWPVCENVHWMKNASYLQN